MYLHELRIRHLRLIRDLRLSFLDDKKKPRKWTVVIGENGTAKTSILQAIALCAAGSRQVNRLVGKLAALLRDRRATDRGLEVEAEFRIASTDQALSLFAEPTNLLSQVTMNLGESDLGGVAWTGPNKPGGNALADDPLVRARSENQRGWFVAAYGVARALPEPVGEKPPLNQPSLERLETLFRPGVGLTALGFANYFDSDQRHGFVKLLKTALKAHASLVPSVKDVELRGRGGVRTAGDLMERDRFEQAIGRFRQKVPAIALSHGYQSTIAWIADLIGHALLDNPEIRSLDEVRGLVLIDEIDLYLHPSWQQGLVDALRQTFPNVQFVVTTHSPVLLASVRPEEIVRLGHDQTTGDIVRMVHDPETGQLRPYANGAVPDLRGEPDPRRLTGTEIFRDWFGLLHLTLNPLGEKLKQYRWLAADPTRSDKLDQEMRRLKQDLEAAGIRSLDKPVERRSG
ncbi:MAG: AAA family ATPase [Planctomycetota bacterium]